MFPIRLGIKIFVHYVENMISKYQGFSLLTANPYVLIHPEIIKIAQKHKVEPEQIIFRFAQLIGIIPLTGTTDFVHMQQDLACDNFELSETGIRVY